MFISNLKKLKCQVMSKHLKDPKNTLDLRGLSINLNYIFWVWDCGY